MGNPEVLFDSSPDKIFDDINKEKRAKEYKKYLGDFADKDEDTAENIDLFHEILEAVKSAKFEYKHRQYDDTLPGPSGTDQISTDVKNYFLQKNPGDEAIKDFHPESDEELTSYLHRMINSEFLTYKNAKEDKQSHLNNLAQFISDVDFLINRQNPEQTIK